MKAFDFTVIASGLDPETEDFEDRFFEAGCDDATISFSKGLIVLEFHREAKNFAQAVYSAAADILKAGALLERVEPDYLVSGSDIAARCGLSRAAVSLYAKGERCDHFPPPVLRITSESPLWDWVAVSQWMFRNDKIASSSICVEARVVKRANEMLADSKSALSQERLAQLA